MLPIPPALLDERERKLYTLLALKELGSCTHTQLLYFMVENEIMSYFDLALALPELVNGGQAAKIAHPADSLYQITAAGLETVDFFVHKLPHSKVVRIHDSAPSWRERFAIEQEYSAKIVQQPGGEYVAQLRLVEGSCTVLSIDVPAPEHKMADRFAQAWPRHAGEIYQYLMETLGEEPKKE